MTEQEWKPVPIGLDAPGYVSRVGSKKVLVAVHSLVAGQRLLDVVDLIESDPRVQLVYSQAPAVFSGGVGDYLKSLGAMRIPWAQATRERFDLALAAAHADNDRIHAPLMVFPHGASFGKRAGGSAGPVYGLDAGRLTRDGRVLPSSLVLSHDSQLELLERQCPPALDVALVAGDPCFDRMLASTRKRAEYRAALGVGPERRLVLVTSTWGPHSLFSRFERYLPTLLRQLDPARYRVAMMMHPGVWFGHGLRQVRSWLGSARTGGMLLVEPDEDWRGFAIAADYVIGDQGSTTVYAAALGKPVLCTDLPIESLNPDSPQTLLGTAPRLVRSQPIEPQLLAAAQWRATVARDAFARLVTSRPGQSHRLLRQEMYRLLGITARGRHRAVEPVPVPVAGERRWR
ncbi:hypothetical protein [Actinophytocola gossypii]|uniref:CDP-glycerol--glycerophosphate glycerophosphotransferase n=1 Tax=Actinophytocola gossypii TaxID=2812003 RepID=A0ABT2JGU7_9PSEU|nr:hypothetical protein [Actinophytocola gossypii]MCT2586931.1 hypothetical protein [Actinophytocola gossypii]